MAIVNDPLTFDFGFTAVNEDELESVRMAQQTSAQLSEQIKTVDNRAKMLYDTIMPLINNLKNNPEKDYIYWPNRYEKLDAFADNLYHIMNGE
jgi:folate-dependent tRNA-U54 methylase TrmFO/GidA